MTHRRPLLRMLDAHERAFPGDAAAVARIRALVETHADCFARTCMPGHVTASAWLLDASRERFLLTHHAKLGRWLQLGGHADGDPDVIRVARREIEEESGIAGWQLVEPFGRGVPLDVDVHAIPARCDEPAHEHHDLRFLFVAPPDARPVTSAESHELRWFPMDALESAVTEAGMLRMARRVRAFLAGG